MDKIMYTLIADGSFVTMLLTASIIDLKDTTIREEKSILNDENLEIKI